MLVVGKTRFTLPFYSQYFVLLNITECCWSYYCSLMFGDVLLAYQRHHSPPGTSELTPSCQIRTSPAVVIDQPDIFTAVLAPAEKEGEQGIKMIIQYCTVL